MLNLNELLQPNANKKLAKAIEKEKKKLAKKEAGKKDYSKTVKNIDDLTKILAPFTGSKKATPLIIPKNVIKNKKTEKIANDIVNAALAVKQASNTISMNKINQELANKYKDESIPGPEPKKDNTILYAAFALGTFMLLKS